MRTDRELTFPDQTPAERGLTVRHFDDGVSQSGREPNDLFLATPPSPESQQGFDTERVSIVSGLDSRADGRSMALLDVDRDGFVDVATANANPPFLELFRNEIGALAPTRRFVAAELEGGARASGSDLSHEGAWSNRSGIGARLELQLGSESIVKELRAGEGLAAQNSSRLVIGIGDAESVDAVVVRWPSGRIQRAGPIAMSSLVRFDERGDVEVSAYASHPRPPARTATSDPPPELPIGSLGAGGDHTGPSLHLFVTMATDCAVCGEQLAALRWLAAQLGGDLAIHGVATDGRESASTLDAWMARHAPPYDLLGRPGGDAGAELVDAVARHVDLALGGGPPPASIVTDAGGAIRRLRWGLPTVSELRANVPRPSALAIDATGSPGQTSTGGESR